MPVKIIYLYARKDETLLDELRNHLKPLKHLGVIDWYDRDINAGQAWGEEINRQINEAQVILLLVSSYFLASRYCFGQEMKRALERHDNGEAYVIPILLRPCHWHGAPFDKLQVMPRNGRPITAWRNRDQAFDGIVTEISTLAKSITRRADPDVGKEKLDKNPLQETHANVHKEDERQLNKEALQAQNVKLGLNRWDLGRMLIYLLIFLVVIGAIFTGFSFLLSIILPIATGFGLLVAFETLYATKYSSKEASDNNLTKVSEILQPRYLGKNRKLQIGSIILLVILFVGIVYYALQPHPVQIPNTSYQGILKFQDNLSQNNSDFVWMENADKNNPENYCKFTDSGYHASVLGNGSGRSAHFCVALKPDFSNFAFTIEMAILRSNSNTGEISGGGIIFRDDLKGSKIGYIFNISENDIGTLSVLYTQTEEISPPLKEHAVPGLQSGEQTYFIEVVAQGGRIQIYVNNQLFTDLTDLSSAHGMIGVFAQSREGQTEVRFNSLEVWML